MKRKLSSACYSPHKKENLFNVFDSLKMNYCFNMGYRGSVFLIVGIYSTPNWISLYELKRGYEK